MGDAVGGWEAFERDSLAHSLKTPLVAPLCSESFFPTIASVFTLRISEAVGLTPLSLGSVPSIRHVAPPLSLSGPDFMGAGRFV
jgi:hypothetical protein